MDVMQFVRAYIHEHGHGPARIEVSEALGWKDKSTASVFMMALERRGWVRLKLGSPRYVRLLHDEVPVVFTGPIAAGQETVAYERIVDQVRGTVADWFHPYPDFFVELCDDSMRGAGLRTGDLIAIRRTESVEIDEQIVVVRTPGEITLRRLRRVDERRVKLSAESTHSTHPEQVVHLDEDGVRIEGVMLGALVGLRPAPDEAEREGKPANESVGS